jgi:hypothetical protein
MNNVLNACPPGPARGTNSTRPGMLRFMRMFASGALAALGAAGCGEQDAVQVELHARHVPEESPIHLKIEAQVAGPTDGLQYKWFAVSGECEPQESDQPKTVFRFSEGVRQDRVSVEIWRNNKRVAQNEIKVKYDEDQARRERTHTPEVQIEIRGIPPADIGGPKTRADIAGRVSGKVSPDYAVAIYARAYGAWYVQPEAGNLHQIKPDHTWETWTHTGTRYAALLVRRDFEPLTKLDMLPQTNDYILALDIVDGLPQPQPTNAAPLTVPSSQ